MSSFTKTQNQFKLLKPFLKEDLMAKLRCLSKPQGNPQIPKLQGSYILQEENLPLYGFSSEGYPVYPNKVNGHFLWDVPEAHMCNPDCPCLEDPYDDDEDFEIMRRR